MPAGVVVAGGRSTRFGDEDKALAVLAGTPMVRRVADRLAPAVDALVVNCRADQRAGVEAAMAGYPHPVAVAVDREPDRGPVAGLARGLDAVDAAYAMVAACDVPFLDPDLADYLLDAAAGRDAAVPRPAEWYEPLHAAYRAAPAAAACEDALAAGDGRAVAPLDRLDWVEVGADELARFDDRSFESVDTRAAFAAAERELS
ncbi:MAG: molybdenum cofactor guanylyltransferase [Haloferacaceae archaeon]